MSNLGSAIESKMGAVANRIATVRGDSERLVLLRKHIGKIVVFNIDEIDTSQNIRKTPIDRESPKFRQLVESIKSEGLLQNIVVELRECGDGSFSLVCLAGHRRIAAMQELKTDRITCLLLEKKDSSRSTSAALSENQNREDLHYLDIADGYGELISQGWSIDQVSNHFERDRKTIQRYLKMSKWAPEVKDLIRVNSDKISLRVVIHEFVNRSFENDQELLKALKEKLRLNRQGGTKKSSPRKQRTLSLLDEYFKERADISQETKHVVEEVLKHLKII